MTENIKKNQMIEQIFTNIDSIGEKMEKTIDLDKDVAPFMSATLAKIKQLALAKEDAYEAQFELFQIATNYLPRTLNAYCALPIEYRNTRVIKENKTARQFLIEDLKLFKKQVGELEKQFYSSIESEIKVNSSVVRAKYENKFQLADELDNLGNDGFVNQFDFSQYKTSIDYKNITFKKETDEELLKTKEITQKRKEMLNKAGSVIYETLSNGFMYVSQTIKKNAWNIKRIIKEIFEFILPFIIIGGFAFIVLGGLYSLISNVEKPKSYFLTINDKAKEIHDVMKVSIIPQKEFINFTTSKEKEFIDDSSYRKERTKFISDEKTGTLTILVSDISKSNCQSTIDQKELGYDAATIKINGIDLPQDNTVSNYLIFTNENHQLCHLKEENKISFEFNNQKIYDYSQTIKNLPEKEKEIRISRMNEEIKTIQEEMKKYSSESSGYARLKNLSDDIKINIQNLNKKPEKS